MNTNTPTPQSEDEKDDAAWDALLADPENVHAQEALARQAAELARSGALGGARPMKDGSDDAS